MNNLTNIITNDTFQKKYTQLFNKNTRIVLVGGCFDIIHIGHIRFLTQAKKGADMLIVLLESDSRVAELKGKNRPYFSQKERAEMLASLKAVDLVILLQDTILDEDYNNLVLCIKPQQIAITQHDTNRKKKIMQAKKSGAKIKIISLIKTASTSKVAKLLGVD